MAFLFLHNFYIKRAKGFPIILTYEYIRRKSKYMQYKKNRFNRIFFGLNIFITAVLYYDTTIFIDNSFR